ncbi:hypothetical protein H312_03299 [Anncaliia algerae PRA339]|uniref:Uncharacterized protein n=1 Tax=Anncaliia algerae PRA339 TaxID=1288291 RepID=A0A059EW95_9MICR|nr:hypothetical protein H312_03299 [Anncaliia algerae PRA339]
MEYFLLSRYPCHPSVIIIELGLSHLKYSVSKFRISFYIRIKKNFFSCISSTLPENQIPCTWSLQLYLYFPKLGSLILTETLSLPIKYSLISISLAISVFITNNYLKIAALKCPVTVIFIVNVHLTK